MPFEQNSQSVWCTCHDLGDKLFIGTEAKPQLL
jgi:hypothetical protein